MALISVNQLGFTERIKDFLVVNSFNWDVYELSVFNLGAIVIEGER